MADRIILQVTRYRPEAESRPTTEDYEIPLRKDWSVLDGLNHVKDHVDGTLSYRWSCRMGICGSCGMTIDGEPKLACATFLTDCAPGPVRIEPLANFPVVRDLVVEILGRRGLLPVVPAGAFYALVDISRAGEDSLAFCKRLLQDKSVAAVPGITFGPQSDRYIRIAFTINDADLRIGLERLAEQLA